MLTALINIKPLFESGQLKMRSGNHVPPCRVFLFVLLIIKEMQVNPLYVIVEKIIFSRIFFLKKKKRINDEYYDTCYEIC